MSIEATGAIVSIGAAIVSGFCALWSFFNERRINKELKADEKLIFGKPHNPPNIQLADHRDCVVQIPIHNVSTSKRAFVTKVLAYRENEAAEEITWSDSIDHLGTPEKLGEVIKVSESTNLFLRVNSSESIDYLTIKIFHSFSCIASVVVFNRFESRE